MKYKIKKIWLVFVDGDVIAAYEDLAEAENRFRCLEEDAQYDDPKHIHKIVGIDYLAKDHREVL